MRESIKKEIRAQMEERAMALGWSLREVAGKTDDELEEIVDLGIESEEEANETIISEKMVLWLALDGLEDKRSDDLMTAERIKQAEDEIVELIRAIDRCGRIPQARR